MEFQSAKQVALNMFAAIDSAPETAIAETLGRFVTPDYRWRGYHPFHELTGADEVAARFWTPFRSSVRRMQRRMDIFFAGANEIDGGETVWVASMGHLMGLFDAPWLGIQPTGKIVMLRYGCFDRIEGDRVAETAMYFDIPHLMAQAGQNPFPEGTAAQLVQPGPLTHDGLLFDAHDPEKGRATLAAINAMTADLGSWNLGLPIEEELARTWNDDMIWWGPTGIGASYTIERYAKQHAGPFRAALRDRSKTRHVARLAEGDYGGFFGWPNFSATTTGGLMGQDLVGKRGDFRVIDFYRQSGGKLAENWIFIDLLHFWNMLGIDFLGQATGTAPQP